MSTICVLNTADGESTLQDRNKGTSGCRPISLLAFLQAENRKLRRAVAQLERDTMALREALRKS